MKYNFPYALEAVLKHEGGWSKNPRDRGGATNYGVTLQTFSLFLGRQATEAELKVITQPQVAAIYGTRYWAALRCDDLPSGLDYAVFDMGVNSGVGRSARLLQGMVDAAPDGIIGPRTLEAVNAYIAEHGAKAAIETFCAKRQHYLEALTDFDVFGRGWTRRVKEVCEAAKGMA